MIEVQDAITEIYGKENYHKIIKGFSKGVYHHVIPGDIETLIFDLAESNYDVDETIYGNGGYGEYPIEIRSFGPLIWVAAQEFDSIEYFKSFDEALSCAESTYETKG
ncbi:hypothetical protein N9502_03590 [Vicingaceae bacterium]|nr:hypothetical protein [Vicingaceae bacterium]